MRKATCKTRSCVIYRQLDEIRLSDLDRQRARYALRDAEVLAHAVIWLMERIASLGAAFPKPGFKQS
jgi:hypothetical protein